MQDKVAAISSLPDIPFTTLAFSDNAAAISIRCAALPKPLEGPLLRLGEQLSSGADPEQALDALDESVRLTRDSLREKCRAAVRLYPSLGLAAGCLLAVLLL